MVFVILHLNVNHVCLLFWLFPSVKNECVGASVCVSVCMSCLRKGKGIALYFSLFSSLPENPAQRRRKNTGVEAGNTEPKTGSRHTDAKNVLPNTNPALVTVTRTVTVTHPPPPILTLNLAKGTTNPRNTTITNLNPETTLRQMTALLQTCGQSRILLATRDFLPKTGVRKSLCIVQEDQASLPLSHAGRKWKYTRQLRQSVPNTGGKSPRNTKRKEARARVRSIKMDQREKTSLWWKCGKGSMDLNSHPAVMLLMNVCRRKSETSTKAWNESILRKAMKGWNVDGQTRMWWQVGNLNMRGRGGGGDIQSPPPVTVIKGQECPWRLVSCVTREMCQYCQTVCQWE